jgi:serine/threonine-protein kinase HipA
MRLTNPVGRGRRLSPLYDVVPHQQLGTERRLHLSLGPHGCAATLSSLLESHGQFGLLRAEAVDALDRIGRKALEWRTRLEALSGRSCTGSAAKGAEACRG